MLCEIFCEEFHQKRIPFHDGLNVVLGTPTADNSIGKSTLMLIIDFIFGGNTYTEAVDILENVGDHNIGFKFRFDNTEYFFSRAITDRTTVWKCDSSYSKVSSIPLNDYCKWLADQYNVSLYKLSFRDVVGRYIRAYGKDNCDEKHPLHAVSSESGEKASVALLKLFDRYKVVDELERHAKESAEDLQTYTHAQARSYVSKINKRKYIKNEKDIEAKIREVDQLASELDKGLLDLDSITSEHAIEIKRKLSHAKRIRSRLRVQMSTLSENAEYKFSDTSDTLTELCKFFPNAEVKHIEEVEKFHTEITKIFRSELQAEQRNLSAQLNDINDVIVGFEGQLTDLIGNPNLSKMILQKHADTIKQIEQMKRENDAYEKTQELKRIANDSKEKLLQIRGEQFGVIEKQINTEMDRLNSLLYVEKYNSPVLHFGDSNYTFHTPDDTGTGIAYKGMVVFDLAILRLTKLPILVHDSLILKQISDDAIENILIQYSLCDKQVIIALDKQDSYSEKTSSILEGHAVVHLAPKGEELFGRSWGKQSAK